VQLPQIMPRWVAKIEHRQLLRLRLRSTHHFPITDTAHKSRNVARSDTKQGKSIAMQTSPLRSPCTAPFGVAAREGEAYVCPSNRSNQDTRRDNGNPGLEGL